MTSVNVIIDTDPGVDDFLAIALALKSPELVIEAFTTTGGNVALRHTNANMLQILEALNRPDVPVYRGSQRPLVGSFGDAEDVHGVGGLPISLPRPSIRTRDEHAVKYMAQRLNDGPPVTLIALGPPTNVARLFRDHPGSVKSVERVVIMGGALDVPGNVTDYAEFNVWSDPEATALVFGSGVPVTMVGSDVCNQVRIYADKTPVPVNSVIRRLTEAQYVARPRRRITLYDPLTVMAVTRPGIVKLERLSIAVDISNGPERGRTRRDPAGAMIDVATCVDVKAAIGLFTERVIQGRF